MAILIAKTRRSLEQDGILRHMAESASYDWAHESLDELMSHDRDYWHSRTPQERLAALSLMNQKTYGYDPATVRMKRVIEIVNLKDYLIDKPTS
jgi:hypothetical protein